MRDQSLVFLVLNFFPGGGLSRAMHGRRGMMYVTKKLRVTDREERVTDSFHYDELSSRYGL
jgi:hypothetical protein